MNPKLLYLITEDWFFCSHFIERAVAARSAGYDVVVVAREREHGERIRAAGLRLIPLAFSRSGTNPLQECRLMLALMRIYRNERPSLVHHIAVKPILYGSLAALLSGVRAIVNAPVGMGYVFSSRDLRARCIRPLLRLAYRCLMNPRGSKVVFENIDDLQNNVSIGIVNPSDAVLVRGAGVDISHFQPAPPSEGTPVVVLVARMLWDKGIGEFVAAARTLHEQGVRARFVLVGDPDPSNPASIPVETLQGWSGRHGVEWWGRREDMTAVLGMAHIACLPSYREGLPKSLLEAAACGLPIVTTDTPGCREVVTDGDNGLLVPVFDVEALAAALLKMIADPVLRQRMGARGRKRVEEEFSSAQVVGDTLSLYARMLPDVAVASRQGC